MRLATAVPLLLLLPLAQGQGLTVVARDVPGDLAPGGLGGALVLDFDAACGDLLATAALATPVVLSPKMVSPFLNLSGDMTADVPYDACLQTPTGRALWNHTLTVAAVADAPGLEILQGRLLGTIDRPEGQADLTGEGDFRARAAFVGGIEIEVGPARFDAATGEGSVNVTVRNLGNAKTTAVLAVDSGGGLIGPSELVLYARQSGLGNEATATFRFVPDGAWTTAQYRIDVRSHAFAAAVFRGESASATVTFSNPGSPRQDAAAPAGAFLGLGILAVAVLARRRSFP